MEHLHFLDFDCEKKNNIIIIEKVKINNIPIVKNEISNIFKLSPDILLQAKNKLLRKIWIKYH